jgi:hypothetical protein
MEVLGPHHGHQYSGLIASENSRVHNGDNHNHYYPQGKSHSISWVFICLTIKPHQPGKQPEKQPDRIFAVPFGPDPDYIHRGSIEEELYSKLSVSTARVALVGLGGIG